MTLLVEKFNYGELSRESVNGERLYTTPTGNLPSVTTILTATQPPEKKAGLERWRKSVGYAKAQQITTEAANRGTRMHTYLENYVLDGTIKDAGSNPYSQEAHLMATEIIMKGMVNVNECWGSEVSLYFPGIYAGSTDLVGVHNDEPAIMDFKQSNKPKKDEYVKDYCLQLAAYAEAHNEVYGTKISRGVIMMCVKPKEVSPGVYEGQQYQEWVIEGTEFEKWRRKWWERVEEYYQSKM